MRSQVHSTSRAVNGLPSCHLTPWRSGKVNSVPSSFHDQLVAKSGTIDCKLACATSCLYMTRLLKTCIIGCSAARVDSSRIDMLAGLSKCDSLRIPPLFCALADVAANAIRNPATTAFRKPPNIVRLPPTAMLDRSGGLSVRHGLRDTTD